MSISVNTYVGPYLKIFNPEKDSKEEYHSCPNKKCKEHSSELSSKFCPTCGHKVELVEFPCKDRASMWEILEDLGDNLSNVMREYKPDKMDDYEFIIPNIEFLKRETRFYGYRETYFVGINDKLLVEETLQFNIKFKKEIEFLNETFGSENVTVEWGVLGWLS